MANPIRKWVATALLALAVLTLFQVLTWEVDGGVGVSTHAPLPLLTPSAAPSLEAGSGSTGDAASAAISESGGGVSSGGGGEVADVVCAPDATVDGVACTAGGVQLTLGFAVPGSCGLSTEAEVVEMESLHHGVYKMSLRGGGRFVLKPECRPAAKWHGQQGWPETATYALSRALFGVRSTVPCARGATVALPARFKHVVHKDGCGLDLAPPLPDASAGHTLTGIALAFTAHDETVLKKLARAETLQLFAPSKTRLVPKERRTFLADVSDVLLLDYLTLNPDREEKNWFYDPTRPGRLLSMDNGWAFVGAGYAESVCSSAKRYLSCPPVFEWTLKKAKKRGGCPDAGLAFCLFRRDTSDRLRALRSAWGRGAGAAWAAGLARDPLLRALAARHNTWAAKAPAHAKVPRALYSVALARFVHGCAGAPASEAAPAVPLERLLEWLADGVGTRLGAAVEHIDQCVAKHGEAYVFQVSD